MSIDQPGLEIGQPPPNKLKTAAWFLLRPYTYLHMAEMLRRLASRSLRRLEASGPEAREWGEALAMSPLQALEAVLGHSEYPAATSLHAEVFRRAEAHARGSGVGMGGAANLDLLYHLVRGLEARCVLETGVAYGWSSLSILLAQAGLGRRQSRKHRHALSSSRQRGGRRVRGA